MQIPSFCGVFARPVGSRAAVTIMYDLIHDSEQARSVDELLHEPARLRTGIEHHHLEAAIALHTYGTFRKAAEALGAKTDTVNRRIRELEFQLGAPLFERSKRRAVPTRLGRIFLEHASHMLYGFFTMVEGVRRIAKGDRGEIAVGCCGPVVTGRLSELLFNPSFAPADLRILPVELAQDQLLEALGAERIDVAIVAGLPSRFRGCAMPLWSQPVLAVMPACHPAATKSQVTWDDLSGEALMLSRRDTPAALRELMRKRLGDAATAGVSCLDVSTATLAGLVSHQQRIAVTVAEASGLVSNVMVVRPVTGPEGREELAYYACSLDEVTNPALPYYLAHLSRLVGCDPGSLLMQ